MDYYHMTPPSSPGYSYGGAISSRSQGAPTPKAPFMTTVPLPALSYYSDSPQSISSFPILPPTPTQFSPLIHRSPSSSTTSSSSSFALRTKATSSAKCFVHTLLAPRSSSPPQSEVPLECHMGRPLSELRVSRAFHREELHCPATSPPQHALVIRVPDLPFLPSLPSSSVVIRNGQPDRPVTVLQVLESIHRFLAEPINVQSHKVLATLGSSTVQEIQRCCRERCTMLGIRDSPRRIDCLGGRSWFFGLIEDTRALESGSFIAILE